MKGLSQIFKRWRDNDVYIDLGTANTLVMDRHNGLITNEPSVISYLRGPHGVREIVAVGSQAKRQLDRTPDAIVTAHPLKDGVVADLETTHAMIKYFLHQASRLPSVFRPQLVMSLPHDVNDVERQAVRDCGLSAGAAKVILIEEPMAAAIGAGLPIGSSRGSMIIDIGGGTSEIAIISLYGIVHCESVRIGGHAFDQAIVDHLRKTYQLAIGNPTAEELKIKIATALSPDPNPSLSIVGIDIPSGLPKRRKIHSSDIYEALSPLISEVVDAALRAIQKVPPELLSDIMDSGAVVAGGGALMTGIDLRLQQELGIPIVVDSDPLTTIARGGYQALINPALLSRIAFA